MHIDQSRVAISEEFYDMWLNHTDVTYLNDSKAELETTSFDHVDCERASSDTFHIGIRLVRHG